MPFAGNLRETRASSSTAQNFGDRFFVSPHILSWMEKHARARGGYMWITENGLVVAHATMAP